jgi:hypothetical protein
MTNMLFFSGINPLQCNIYYLLMTTSLILFSQVQEFLELTESLQSMNLSKMANVFLTVTFGKLN